MTYISGTFKQPFLLPNKKEASSMSEVEAFLKEEGLAMASDYSQDYVLAKKRGNEFKQKQDLFDDFLTNYKRMIFS